MKPGVVRNTGNNCTHLLHASSLDYFNRTKDKQWRPQSTDAAWKDCVCHVISRRHYSIQQMT